MLAVLTTMGTFAAVHPTMVVNAEPLEEATPVSVSVNVQPRRTLWKWTRGQDAKDAQHMLNAVMHAGLSEDGIWGPASMAACRNYQASRGLAVDGICGRNTWNALERDYNNLYRPQVSSVSSQSYSTQTLAERTHERQGSRECVITSISELVSCEQLLERNQDTISKANVRSWNNNSTYADWSRIINTANSTMRFRKNLTTEGAQEYWWQNRQRVIDLLSTRPEGVVVYFYANSSNAHAVRFAKYDGQFWVSDPGQSQAYVPLSQSWLYTGWYSAWKGNEANLFSHMNRIVYYS